VEGIRASGATALEEIVFGVIPQVLPLWVSCALYRFEFNMRSATVVGMGRRQDRRRAVGDHARVLHRPALRRHDRGDRRRHGHRLDLGAAAQIANIITTSRGLVLQSTRINT